MSLFNDNLNDDNPEYDNTLGRLPNGNNLPEDDKPSDDYVDFGTFTGIHSNEERETLNHHLGRLGLHTQYETCMKEPLRLFQKWDAKSMEHHTKVGELLEQVDKGKHKKNTEQTIESNQKLKRFYWEIAELWASEIVLMMNATLHVIAAKAEAELGDEGKKLAKEFEDELYERPY